MKLKLVEVPSIKELIVPSPGFEKKQLSEYKLDPSALCGSGCKYCSSNNGNYLRINRKRFADLTEAQTGERTYPATDPALTFVWPDVLGTLASQLDRKPPTWGYGKTLQFSMLTDGFSPNLVKAGTTRAVLERVVGSTAFRIRVLTKNAVVGSDEWIDFFARHRERFVVGLSVGTLDDDWARVVEINTAPPTKRLRALRRLQDAGVPTFGMLCPVFPAALEGDELERLVDALQPNVTETVWAEPYNDRLNWRVIRDGYPPGSPALAWFDEVYGQRQWHRWSGYATDLYLRLHEKAVREGWIAKLKYLLYEDLITEADAPSYAGFEGVLLQSKRGTDGLSANPHVAAIQRGATPRTFEESSDGR